MRGQAHLILRDILFLKQGAPAVSNDIRQGYEVGHRWLNVTPTPHEEYVCLNPAAGAAVWRLTTGVTGALHLALTPSDLSAASNVPSMLKIPVDYTDVAAIGTGSMTGVLPLFTLPAGYKIMDCLIVKAAADANWVAASLTALTVTIGPAGGSATKYAGGGGALDVHPTGSLVKQSNTVAGIESMTGGVSIDSAWAATGANLEDLSSGALNVYVSVIKLP